MNSIVKTAKTVNEAIEAALKELNATRDMVDVEVQEESKSGFLKLGGPRSVLRRLRRPARRELRTRDDGDADGAEHPLRGFDRHGTVAALRDPVDRGSGTPRPGPGHPPKSLSCPYIT